MSEPWWWHLWNRLGTLMRLVDKMFSTRLPTVVVPVWTKGRCKITGYSTDRRDVNLVLYDIHFMVLAFSWYSFGWGYGNWVACSRRCHHCYRRRTMMWEFRLVAVIVFSVDCCQLTGVDSSWHYWTNHECISFARALSPAAFIQQL